METSLLLQALLPPVYWGISVFSYFFTLSPVTFLANLQKLPSPPSFLDELTNVLSFPSSLVFEWPYQHPLFFPSSSFCMRSKYSSLSLSSLVFDDNQKRQGICSSLCHPSKCVCISSRDLRCFYNLKIAGRFCIQQNQAMTLHSWAVTHQKRRSRERLFLLFYIR